MEKLGIICIKGLESFILNIKDSLSEQYEVKLFLIDESSSAADLKKVIEWSDIIWLEWANEAAIYCTHLPEIAEKKVILRLHSYEALHGYAEQIQWEFIDCLILIADHMLDILLMSVPNIKDRCPKIEIIPNGLNLSTIACSQRSGEKIAMVCELTYKKNPQFALQILAKLPKSYTLHIAGAFKDMRHKIYIEHMVRALKIEDRVSFYGHLTGPRMDEFWKDKAFILSTSIHEGHPYNIMEGMARGLKPVIHNFYGAAALYQDRMLFNTIDEAVSMILYSTADTINSFGYQSYVKSMGWTLNNQMQRINETLKGLTNAAD